MEWLALPGRYAGSVAFVDLRASSVRNILLAAQSPR